MLVLYNLNQMLDEISAVRGSIFMHLNTNGRWGVWTTTVTAVRTPVEAALGEWFDEQ